MQVARIYIVTINLLLTIISSLYSQEDLKICAIRVEFQQEDNNLTTGEGRFMLDDSDVTPFTIDPPPHDRRYFQDQIIAVNNYFSVSSQGKLNIVGEVFPLEETSAYQLPQPMGYYNPNTTDEENNLQLAHLFLDAISLADEDEEIIFADYDLVTIFHAGVGNDINLGFDETPQDIPSLYISQNFLKQALGDTFAGISVDGGAMIIDRGILLPETESQAGLELAVTGIFAANVGSYLDMYDLFSPSDKLAGIGRFGLMDSGLFNLFGLTPALPCAFTRELMGWDQPSEITMPETDLSISRFIGDNSALPTILKIPVNSDEYYLVEFRGDYSVNIDSLFEVLAEDREELPTYLEVLKTYFPDRIVVSDSTGVLLSVDDYDWGLPGAGILIWHIDQSIVREKGSQNAINDDKKNRAVDLEEADGSQDIGYEYSIVEPGFNSELGTWLDFWFEENPAPIFKNEFSTRSSPNSRNNRNYAESHINLSGFSNNTGDVMMLDYTREFFEDGFPLSIESDEGVTFSDPIIGAISPIDATAWFCSDSTGKIYAVSGRGQGILTADNYLIARFSDTGLPDLALADMDNDDKYDRLIACSKSGAVEIFQFTDQNADSLIDTVRTHKLNESITTVPVVKDLYFYIGTESGKIIRFLLPEGELDSTFTYSESINTFTVTSSTELTVVTKSESQTDIPPAIIDLDSDDQFETIYVPLSDEIIVVSDAGENIIRLDETMISRPAFADVDNDGLYEIVYNSNLAIQALNYNGSKVSNFPIRPILQNEEYLTGTPIIFDADGDENSDILVVTSIGQIFAFNSEGQILSGFPTSIGGRVTHTPVADDLDSDGFIEILSLNQNGDIYAWQLDTNSGTTLWWNQASFAPTNNTLIEKQLTPVVSESSELMPAKSVYNYPNPNKSNYTIIRYFLKNDARVQIKIFDLAGDIVDSFEGPGQGNVHNERRWELADISSGVYLCRIEANSATENTVRIIKIMVVN